jgi:uncharacterized protein YkwD
MTVRNEMTLRRMWEESLTLSAKATKLADEETASTEEAEKAERIAEVHRSAAAAAGNTGRGMAEESADLADIVNRERAEAGLPALVAGEPYDGAPQDPAGLTIVNEAALGLPHAGPGTTLVDGQVPTP